MRRNTITLTLLSVICALLLPAVSLNAQIDPLAEFKLSEGSGRTVQGGGSATGHISGIATWTKVAGGKTCLTLDGGVVEIDRAVVDTSRSFAVSAWVKLNQLGGFQTFVSVDGQVISGFFLQLRQDTGKFAFTVPGADDGQSGVIAGAGFSPKTDTWYYLLGVHNANDKTISLYVNGVLQRTVPYRSQFKANGPTAIGRGKFNGRPVDFTHCDIRDVNFYASPNVNSSALNSIADQTGARNSRIVVDWQKQKRPLSPKLYGLMIEDINYCICGGLYAELIRNRTFKESKNSPAFWKAIREDGQVVISLDHSQNVPNTALTTALLVDTTRVTRDDRSGVKNEGYFGIPVRPETTYKLSFYAKSTDNGIKTLTASIVSRSQNQILTSSVISGITTNWKKFTTTLRTGNISPSTDNDFCLTTGDHGKFLLNQVSLFPPTYNGRPNGARPDLMQILADMKPSFLRLPGGNFLEGNYFKERFNWKETVGDISQRPGHQNPWGYWSDDGFGLMEHLLWCEDLKMEPVLGVFAGYALRGEYVPAGPKLDPFIDEAIEEIEYVIGDKNTVGGAKRIRDGHPKPFPLTYVEIGNEDNFDRSGSYEGRYAAFHDRIKARFPQLQLIATMPVKSRKPDLIDDHYYRTADAMAGDANHYDRTDRSGSKIFVGEWASQDIDAPWIDAGNKGPTPSLNSALGDAAWMTGMERNSDHVVISAYAPLFVNVNKGARQWASNLIGFDGLRVYGSPSYYAQVMFSQNHGDQILDSTVEGLSPVYCSPSVDSKTGRTYLKLVNMNGQPQSVNIDLKGSPEMKAKARKIVLSGKSLNDTNTIDNPKNVIPIESSELINGPSFKYTLTPYSITVLVLDKR